MLKFVLATFVVLPLNVIAGVLRGIAEALEDYMDFVTRLVVKKDV